MANIANQPQPPKPNLMRASDADRDRVAQVLADALADGRLDQEEHAERLESLYSAKTLGELVPITADLGTAPASPATGRISEDLAPSPDGAENITAVFGSAERTGRWLVEPRTNVSALFGSVELDLREAVLSQREVVVQCGVVFGGLEVVVPPGVRVTNSTTAIFGGATLKGLASDVPADAPVVRLTGALIFGGVEVKTLAPGAKKKFGLSC
ncbi:DUF1707 SHOCT-like domain-containing protein [Actinorugispora endophytica]|uniref:Cell wall-active antibiotic response 4TMS protein YvqF n=1 Tax=Actinorugispora endophytica TaxID=1605990 RepID=A0A4V3D999_9ACTN|nr:DUF1707 domain-containing protein [Actinorugispora endophytica]TDQ55340.1 cell wall-active antibiotic response 4TMS protein YvqF [Actinorugispora endophytica]